MFSYVKLFPIGVDKYEKIFVSFVFVTHKRLSNISHIIESLGGSRAKKRSKQKL